MKIKELRDLIEECRNAHYRRQLEADLKSHLAIKDIFESVESKKKRK